MNENQYIPRALSLRSRLESRSHFLFGPRQTGKSTLIRHALPEAPVYNLLDSRVYQELSRRPSQLREEIAPGQSLVVIDEIQKLPELLDEVHLMMEEHGVRFLLTGSSARKLRRGGVNLLGGRARSLSLHPFVSCELESFDLLHALSFGLLPPIHLSDQPRADLSAYVGTYLREEVAAEGLTRNIGAFGRFLEVAALCNGTLLNHARIASDAQVARSTVREYFQILEDTLIARTLPAWKSSVKRKPIRRSKLYFFDVGVVNQLQNQGRIRPRSPGFGQAFETYLFHELSSYLDYRGDGSLAFWRSTSGFEVDFILNDEVAIEIKGKETIGKRDYKGLKALQEERRMRRYLVVSLVDRPREQDGCQVLPWRSFLQRLWEGAYA
jgi:predicted AAA+ superfamily ATPase